MNGGASVGDFAFAYNENLTEIKIPDGVQKVGDGIFKDCASLEKIYLLLSW